MMLIVVVVLFTMEQVTGSCNNEGKNCEWNTFTHQCKCQNLDLTCIPENILECPNPITLDLGYNNIKRISATDLHAYRTKLQVLNLRNNHIISIAFGAFNGMENLEMLSLASNNLTSLQTGIFNGLTNLRELYITNNRIISIHENIFSNLTNLKTLEISGNYLSGLPSNIFINLSLTSLDLSSNLLTKVPDVFHNMPKLVKLFLRKNLISVIPQGTISELKGLKCLYLESNNISIIENSALANMIKLEEVYIGNNSIKNLNPEIIWADGVETSYLIALKVLDIHDNQLTRIRADFMRNLPAIEKLNLSGNQISFIEISSFSAMKNLIILKLRQNKLQNFDIDVFKDIEKTPEQICGKMHVFKNLEDLNLAENQLELSPSEELFKILPSLEFLEIDGNPLQCDCSILPLVNWFNESKPVLSSKYYLGKCATPSNLKEIPIATLNSLSVDGPCIGASIKNRKRLISATLGNEIIINCTTIGFPKPNVCWDIPEHLHDAGLEVSEKHIVIQKVSHQHEGIYVCHAENILQNDSVAYQLVIQRQNLLTISPKPITTTRKNATYSPEVTYAILQTTLKYNSKTSKLQTFTIIASILLVFTVFFIIYIIRCHGQQVESCRKNDTAQEIMNNRIARDQRRVYKTLVEEREEEIEIMNLEQ